MGRGAVSGTDGKDTWVTDNVVFMIMIKNGI